MKDTRRKLTKTEVREIRQLYSTGKHTVRELAKLYPVGRAQISNITSDKAWKYV